MWKHGAMHTGVSNEFNVTTAYSFISSASQAYGLNMILNNGKYCFYSVI
ncbi:MAG: hypothetical protein R3A12_14695 [Ignavibacteria bacterium]